MVSWMAQATIIQLSLPAHKLRSSIYNPFSSRFLFPVAFHCGNIYRFNGLHNKPPLLPLGDHACVQNSWYLLEYKLFKAIPML